jgi:hypothetical protein
MQLLDHSRVIAATSEGKRTQGPSFCPVSPATLRGWQQALHPKERTLDNPALRENEAQLQYQALFAACASSATDALPTAFFLPQALDRASPTASSTAFSVKPFFTAFLTAFSNFFAAFFFALSFAIFPHSYFCRRAAFFTVFFTAFLSGVFLAATFFSVDFLPAILVTGCLLR